MPAHAHAHAHVHTHTHTHSPAQDFKELSYSTVLLSLINKPTIVSRLLIAAVPHISIHIQTTFILYIVPT